MTDLRTYHIANEFYVYTGRLSRRFLFHKYFTIRQKSIGIVLSKIDENLCKQTVAICSNIIYQ